MSASRSCPDMNLRLSVVVPVFNSGRTLPSCLDGLLRAARENDEIIVADDCSAESPRTIIDSLRDPRVRLVRSMKNIGRGPIRNLGAQSGSGEVIVFVDSDVVVHSDALDIIRTRFAEGSVCLFGSYDASPSAGGTVSKYRNLLHHYVHQSKGRNATHFWTGLGAVSRPLFTELRGLNDGQWARNMEDVEFGHRVVDSGRTIDVCPEIQGTHLKDFSFRNMLKTDLFSRAIPWSQLILQDRRHLDKFVVSWPQRISSMSSVMMLASLVSGLFWSGFYCVSLVSGLVFFVANWSLWRFFARERGLLFVPAAISLHVVHSALSLLGFALAATVMRAEH